MRNRTTTTPFATEPKFAFALSVVLASAALVAAPFTSPVHATPSLPGVTITSVVPNTGSVKVTFAPVAGAKDYRIWDLSNCGMVKYAGLRHLFADWGMHFVLNADGTPRMPYVQQSDWSGKGPKRLDVPATEIEWNGIKPGDTAWLAVEAVHQLGPVPAGNIGNFFNSMLLPNYATPASIIGSNAGRTLDHKWSINGQGPFTNCPVAIARSARFLVQASGTPALPSGSDATQVFFDGFDDSMASMAPVATGSSDGLSAQYQIMDMAGRWDVFYRKADIKNSMLMVDRGHLMDVLFDGGTPGTNNPVHQCHGECSISPQQSFDFSNGQILHVTFEVDSHFDSRRWVGVELSPADDPLVNMAQFAAPLNATDCAVFSHILGDTPTLQVFTGPSADGSGVAHGTNVIGAAGQAVHYAQRPRKNFEIGHGFDERSRFDLFYSQSKAAIYEDGALVSCEALPEMVPFSKAKVYFTHFVYHTDNEVHEVANYAPYETYWLNAFPYSDERHWDNMGVEVLPTTTDWSTLGNRITH